MPSLAARSGLEPIDRSRLADRAKDFADASVSPNTRRAYRKDWAVWQTWSTLYGVQALPADPESVALFATWLADQGRAVAGIARCLATIAKAHTMAGHDPAPTRHPLVQQVMRGIRRVKGTAQVQKAAAGAAVLRTMVESTGDRLLDKRDRAMLLVGFAGAMRRSEVMAIEVEHLQFTPEGLRIHIPRSKTDQEAKGDLVGIVAARSPRMCPIRAMQEWIEASGITSGPVFRGIAAGGRIRDPNPAEAANGQMVARAVKRCARRAGLDPRMFAGHSLRSGFATTAYQQGKADRQIMRQGRWRSLGQMNKYIRESSVFRDNPTEGIL